MLALARTVLSDKETNSIAKTYRHALIIADNKLLKSIDYEPKIPEDVPKLRYLNDLMTIANNLANYFRLMLKNDPKRFREELERFGK